MCKRGGGETIDSDVLAHTDVFIHEDIRADNPYGYMLSDEYLLPRLKKGCRSIIVPNLFGLGGGFFPQYDGVNVNNKPLKNGMDSLGMFPHQDSVIEKAVANGDSIDKIIMDAKQDVFARQYIIDHFNVYMKKIKDREVAWDIKVSSLIMEYYKKEKLFYDIGHPTEFIINYYAECILKILKIDITEKIDSDPLDHGENPVYPCVMAALGLEWDNQYIRKTFGRKIAEKMDLEEYIKEYIEWCYPDYL